ncbi:hypothetical protein [Methanococcoides sp. FTZ1]
MKIYRDAGLQYIMGMIREVYHKRVFPLYMTYTNGVANASPELTSIFNP